MKWYKLAFGNDNSMIDQGRFDDLQNAMTQPGLPAVPPHGGNQPQTNQPKIKPNKKCRGVLRGKTPVHRWHHNPTTPPMPPNPLETGNAPEAASGQDAGDRF